MTVAERWSERPLFVVYALSLDGLEFRYVGVTTHGAHGRLASHVYTSFKLNWQLPVNRWIRKHGAAAIRVTILEEAPRALLIPRERYWIRKLRSLEYPLLNCTHGGDGDLTEAMQQARANRSAAAKARYERPGEREATGLRSRAHAKLPGVRERYSANAKAGWTPERRAAQSARMKAKWNAHGESWRTPTGGARPRAKAEKELPQP